jgi:hypothetical protein
MFALVAALAVIPLLEGPVAAAAPKPSRPAPEDASRGTSRGADEPRAAPGGSSATAPVGASRATALNGRATSITSATAIGIAPFGPAALSADLRARLEEAATAGLLATGASVATRETVARAASATGLAVCAEPSCLERLAGPVGTRLWLRGTCLVDGSTYRIHLELFDLTGSLTGSPIGSPAASVNRPSGATTPGPGAVVAARDDTCEICTEAEAAEMTNVAASALRAAWKRSTAQAAPPPLVLGRGSGPAGTAAAESRITRISVTTIPAAEPPPRRSTWRRAWPVALLMAGAAAVGGGIYLIHEDGQLTDYRTGPAGIRYAANLYDTKGLAIASFASAGVLIGAAAAVFALGQADAPEPASVSDVQLRGNLF